MTLQLPPASGINRNGGVVRQLIYYCGATPDDPKPRKQMWVALAKPNQALALVLAQVSEGWTVELVPALTEKQLKLFHQIKLKPGEV